MRRRRLSTKTAWAHLLLWSLLMSDQSNIYLRCVVKSMSSAKTIAAVLGTLCAICLILVLVYQYDQYVKLKNFADHAYLPQCYSGASGGGESGRA